MYYCRLDSDGRQLLLAREYSNCAEVHRRRSGCSGSSRRYGLAAVQPLGGSVVKKFAVGMIGVTAMLIACEAAAQDFVIEETTVAGIQQALQTNARTGRQ